MPDFLRPAAPARDPAGGSVRFRVQDVYTITGIGCVVVGQVEAGEIRPDDTFVVLDGTTGALRPLLVRVTGITAHRESIASLRPGTSAGLAIRRVTPETGHLTRIDKHELRRGDLLVPP